MTTLKKAPEAAETRSPTTHPLDPLTPGEIVRAVEILNRDQDIGPRVRYETVVLNEPPKDDVLAYDGTKALPREAFICILDNDSRRTYEAVVSLSEDSVKSWNHIPGVQPKIMLDEFYECEQAVKADPAFREALARRGITDVDLVMVDPWAAGNYGYEGDNGMRLSYSLCWLRSSPKDNGYARPIEGVVPVVDLNEMKVLRVIDHGVVPLPPTDGNYSQNFIHEFREDLKPIEITQPEGPSFTVDGWHVAWQKWDMRLGFTPREGLVLYDIAYTDQGRRRPIIYRTCLSEMVVPYGEPNSPHFRKNAFDAGEYGIGNLANSLTLGCDCLGEIRYFDAVTNNTQGGVMKIPNAICMHEEDFGILWKHVDWRTGETEVRRSRRLVVSFISTVGNYEYGFFWYFYQDGTIQYEVKLTGVLNNAAVPPGHVPEHGTLIAPQLAAHIHQHFFNVRMDMAVDGQKNSVYEVNSYACPADENNPHHNAFYAEKTQLKTESEAQRNIDPYSARYWLITNESETNYLGQKTSYKLMPGENVLPFAHDDASVIKRAGFMTKHLWVTPYDPAEMDAAGDYPNQHPGGAGLPAYTKANRSLDNTDLVVWYTFGHHHVPRPEDWPVMPVMYTGFSLKPVSFFDRNPALDVPPSSHGNGHHCGGHNGSCHA